MADVILFRPKLLRMAAVTLFPRPPLGLLAIAAPLIKNNYTVKIIDEETNIDWPNELNKELNSSTICVGVSSMTGRQILQGLNFSKIVKDRFNIPVIWGGMHPTMLPEQTIKNDLIDILLTREGEESFLQVVNAIQQGRSLKDIAGSWYKEDGRIYTGPESQFVELNNQPYPLPYHLIDIERYINIKRPYLPDCKRTFELNTDRGCPHRCTFCYNINVNKCKWRPLSCANVIKQIEYLVDNFGLDGIDFVADNFFVDKKRVTEICTELIKRKIKITWHTDCRIDYFSKYEDSFIELLKESDCKVLTFGVESGSQRILNSIYKDITLDEILLVHKKLKKWGILPSYHFMAGFPGETKVDLLATYETMIRLYDQNPKTTLIGPSIYTPYPGTPLYFKCVEMGYQPPQKLQDWAILDGIVDPNMPFRNPIYSRWLINSVAIVQRISHNYKWSRWWFRLRTKIIIKFKIVGPAPEEKIISLVKIIANFSRRLFKQVKKVKIR